MVVNEYAMHNGYAFGLGNYSHQYMQAIEAPKLEGNSIYKSYSALNMVNQSYTFYIPVYRNMPASTSLPNKNSPNNYLKTLVININNEGAQMVESNFDGSKTSYTYNVDYEKKVFAIAGSTVRSDAKIEGAGTKSLVVGKNQFDMVVTAANGDKRTYTIIVNRAEPTSEYKPVETIMTETKLNIDGTYITGLTLTTPVTTFSNLVTTSEPKAKVTIKRGSTVITSGNVRTGDIMTVVSGDDSKSYTIVIYGDPSSDGQITILDLLKVQKHLLGDSKLSGAYLKAADVSHDGQVTILDLLKVQKHLLGDSIITQK